MDLLGVGTMIVFEAMGNRAYDHLLDYLRGIATKHGKLSSLPFNRKPFC